MLHERPGIERDVLLALDAEPSRVAVVLGPTGSGRTSVLRSVTARLGRERGRYVDAERVISTPERFLAAVVGSGHDQAPASSSDGTPRTAFDALLDYVNRQPVPGRRPPVLLLDEFVELERLSAFPGLRGLIGEFLDAVARSPNRFVLASRYVTRATRLLAAMPADRITIIHLPPLTDGEVRAILAGRAAGYGGADLTELAGAVRALADGRPGYVHEIATAVTTGEGTSDPVDALAALLATGAPLATTCRFTYEHRLHRARGYGALKGILATLAEEEPLTLSAIARRLRRTPGSTKDYLSWLVDVDLIAMEGRLYRFVDPMLRLWVRLHCRPAPPDDIALAREVQDYAIDRLPPFGTTTDDGQQPSPAGTSTVGPTLATAPLDLIEID